MWLYSLIHFFPKRNYNALNRISKLCRLLSEGIFKISAKYAATWKALATGFQLVPTRVPASLAILFPNFRSFDLQTWIFLHIFLLYQCVFHLLFYFFACFFSKTLFYFFFIFLSKYLSILASNFSSFSIWKTSLILTILSSIKFIFSFISYRKFFCTYILSQP